MQSHTLEVCSQIKMKTTDYIFVLECSTSDDVLHEAIFGRAQIVLCLIKTITAKEEIGMPHYSQSCAVQKSKEKSYPM
jgi:hypothetical protein